ncbi:MAG: DUF4125 family protein [Syntrophales bacterium]|jgi:hypothetical protein|nr:DUF4125 family protein [Syntrophales bacterium]MDY0045035.1 DUF4125 family protein [Syntrophales bacterium]
MNDRETLIDRIIESEQKMFQAVPNMGGRAACQDDVETFRIMRSSQMASWPEAMLESYRNDLKNAEIAERNMFTEKYARMMRSTSPLEYSRIEHLLPHIEPGAVELIDRIIESILIWEQELRKIYPRLMRRGRPLYSTEDAAEITSQETYLKGELATYSLKTLKLYMKHIQKQISEHINGSEITLLHMMKHYGVTSLEAAEEALNSYTD